MKAIPITDSTTLHLFPCKQDRQWVCSTFKLCKAMAFPAPLLFNYWGNLQSWLTPPANQKGKRISKWIQNLKEETEKVQKVVIWYSEDIQSQLFLWLMCQLIEGELWGINIAPLLDKETYQKTYKVHYLPNPITTLCCRLSCVSSDELRAVDCLNHIHRISKAQKEKNATRFERIASKDKGLRAYRNGRILDVRPDFYDKTLIVPCHNEILEKTKKNVRAARLIGECMADLPFEEEVCFIDLFFYQRLEYLYQSGKLPNLVDMDKVKL